MFTETTRDLVKHAPRLEHLFTLQVSPVVKLGNKPQGPRRRFEHLLNLEVSPTTAR